jgi:hypothetical protein
VSWDCQAYGPGGEALGARCFFAEPDDRLCSTPDECHTRMAGERVRLFERIHELAASGDPTGQYLASEFTRPEQLLGGEPPEPNEP